jgi:inner membrane transporter RhtA
VAIEFLGPLTVAAVRSRSRRSLAWPALALLGVVLLTSPWGGAVDPLGILWAALAAVGWGVYIVLTQRIGDRFTGIRGLSLTVPVAALTAAAMGIPQAAGHLTIDVLLSSLWLALLLPVLPYALEMLALRRMHPSAFGTLMALEPAIGLVLGLVVLGQVPTPLQLVGIALVVVAGAAAQREAGPRRSGEPLPLVGPEPDGLR